MILTRHEIRDLIDSGKLNFSPELDAFQNQPHAVDLRLGTTFYIPKIWDLTEKGREILTVDVTESAGGNYEKIDLKPGQFFDLAPGEAIIASTLERIELKSPNVMGVLYPRSSINRRGLSVDLTGIVDVFYSGNLMIPILNKTSSQVIRIFPGERICQIVFQKLTNDIEEDDALLHGKVTAKYHQANGQELASKKDSDQEIKYIKKGDLNGLKDFKF
ncbi:MAG: 2'-deoxycytidine 5'-triphosphate deaminase [Candidatus Peregrinibacteria bacterium]|nr:2'-deoxycytidine 5'-triphosphate deaminase [Candidatus Peregrinibacteria bacterium]